MLYEVITHALPEHMRHDLLGKFRLVGKVFVESHLAYSGFLADLLHGYPSEPVFPEKSPGRGHDVLNLFAGAYHIDNYIYFLYNYTLYIYLYHIRIHVMQHVIFGNAPGKSDNDYNLSEYQGNA